MAIFQLSGTDAVFTQMLSKSPSHSISKPHLYFNITQITTGKANDHEPYDCALVAWQLIHENSPENLLQEQDKYNADTHPTAQHGKLCTYGHCTYIPISEWQLVITYIKKSASWNSVCLCMKERAGCSNRRLYISILQHTELLASPVDFNTKVGYFGW